MAAKDDKVGDMVGQTVEGDLKPETVAKIHAGGLSYKNSLQLAPGTITGIAGVDGNGQQDLADLIVGLQRPERGKLFLNGQDVTALSRE